MFVQEAENPFAHYFVAQQKEELIGYAGMWKVLNEGHITNIAVTPAYRRTGVGRQLLNTLIEEAVKLEIKVLMLEVRKSNKAAIDLYSSAGFVISGCRKGYYPDSEDAILMDLVLMGGNE